MISFTRRQMVHRGWSLITNIMKTRLIISDRIVNLCWLLYFDTVSSTAVVSSSQQFEVLKDVGLTPRR